MTDPQYLEEQRQWRETDEQLAAGTIAREPELLARARAYRQGAKAAMDEHTPIVMPDEFGEDFVDGFIDALCDALEALR